MALAVELYFDARMEESIRSLRERLHGAGVGAAPELQGSRPHITLALVETEDVVELSGLVARFTGVSSACSLRLAALASFASPKGVLYLAPVPTVGLLELHARLHDLLAAVGLASQPLYRPGAWVPHCTLEMGLSGAQLSSAFDSCWRSFTPLDGRLTEAGVVSYPPPIPHFTAPLQVGAERS